MKIDMRFFLRTAMVVIDFVSWILIFAIISIFLFMTGPTLNGILLLIGGIFLAYFFGGVLFYGLVSFAKFNNTPIAVKDYKLCLFCWIISRGDQ